MKKNYDVVVVGGGPAGLTAAIYAGRSNLSVLVIEKEGVGNLWMAHKVDNYPGFPEGITGKDLLAEMKNQAKRYKVEFIDANFLGVDVYSNPKKVITDKINIEGTSIIIALGMNKTSGKKILGEEEFLGNGVSYCATCDGAFTRGRTVSLFGQGEELAEEALFLTRFSKVINIYIKDAEFQCSEELLENLSSKENVNIYLNSHLLELKGSEYLEEARLEINGQEETHKLDFAFMYLGNKTSNELLGEIVNLNEEGYAITNDSMETKVEGIYIAGDIINKKVRQITTATADGTIAGMEAIKYILKNRNKNN